MEPWHDLRVMNLHAAAARGDIDTIRMLLIKTGKSSLVTNIDVNVCDHFNRTSLHMAVEGGHVETVRALCSMGADIGARDARGSTPLHYAAFSRYNYSTETLRALIEVLPASGSADLIDSKNDKGLTALHYAAAVGRIHNIYLLVEGGAKVDAKDNKKSTPLHFAAESAHAGAARTLVKDFGANVHAQDASGTTPLHLAAQNRLQERIHDYVETIRTLVCELGADVNARGSGVTPLHYAVLFGHSPITHTLVVELGADVNAQDDTGGTPLHLAADHSDTIVLLGSRGGNVNARDEIGSTPLHSAARRGSADNVRVLVEELGADVDARDDSGFTPLHYAGQRDTDDVLVLLQALGGKN